MREERFALAFQILVSEILFDILYGQLEQDEIKRESEAEAVFLPGASHERARQRWGAADARKRDRASFRTTSTAFIKDLLGNSSQYMTIRTSTLRLPMPFTAG